MDSIAWWLIERLNLDQMEVETLTKVLSTVAILIGVNVARWVALRRQRRIPPSWTSRAPRVSRGYVTSKSSSGHP
ncbi:MAG: hypothetical protein AAF624_18625, partial [Bacteroidota bacterium]